VEVSFADDVGSDSVRRMLEREVLRELDLGGCFARVGLLDADEAHRDAGDLLLRLVVVSVERETVYDLSLAQRSAPDAAPDAADAYETRVEAAIRLDLLTGAEGHSLRDKNFTVVGRHRPSGGEDARAVARQEMIDEVASTTRYWACRGKRKKLARQLEQLRAAP
jgi:hypothetical protein